MANEGRCDYCDASVSGRCFNRVRYLKIACVKFWATAHKQAKRAGMENPCCSPRFLRQITRRSILLSDGRDQVDDQRVDLAQVFPAAFFRFQFAIADDDREIADLVKHFARDLFDWAI